MNIATTLHLDESTRRAVELRALARGHSVSKAGADLIRMGIALENLRTITGRRRRWPLYVVFAVACAASFAAGLAARGVV